MEVKGSPWKARASGRFKSNRSPRIGIKLNRFTMKVTTKGHNFKLKYTCQSYVLFGKECTNGGRRVHNISKQYINVLKGLRTV